MINKQKGISLVMVLMILTVVTLLCATGFTLATQSARSGAGWSDRQRALFLNESVIKVAETELKSLYVAHLADTIEKPLSEVAGVTYFKNRNVDVNSITTDPWPDFAKKVRVTQDTGVGEKEAEYFFVYEGEIKQGENSPRVTIYTKSGGARSGTDVVISTTYELSLGS